jgi:3-oxoacyl-[acyl-carrier protein] reductase
MQELNDKVAVVTGGARGIGREIALALAREGAVVVAADLDEAGLRETAKCVAQLGAVSETRRANVAEEPDVEALFESTLRRFGTVDILVNNAGICRMVPILDIAVEEWDRMMAVNLRSVFLCSRAAFRLMKEKREGRIISIASAAAKIGGVAAGAHYSASKAGVICFTKSLALQAAPYRINVNAVCPGPTRTEMTDAWGEDVNRAFADSIPWKEYGRPEDIANAVVFLASPRSRYITGEVLDVNGGLVMD